MAYPFQANNKSIPFNILVVQENIKKGDAPPNEANVSMIFPNGIIVKYHVTFKIKN